MPDTLIAPPGSYLVLGASGLVGSHALTRLAGCPGVRVGAVSHSRATSVESENIEHRRADLRDPVVTTALMEGIDYALLGAHGAGSGAGSGRAGPGPDVGHDDRL